MERNMYVFKIKSVDVIRRFAVPKRIGSDGPDLSFSALESKIRDFFRIPVTIPIIIKYTDRDQDVVTLADDEDLEDACVVQSLNPLLLTFTTGDSIVDDAFVEPTMNKTGETVNSDSSEKSASNEPMRTSTFREFIEKLFPEHAEVTVRNFLKSVLPEQTGETLEKILKAVLNATSIQDLVAIYERELKPKGAASAAAISNFIGSLPTYLPPELLASFNFSNLNLRTTPAACQPSSSEASKSSQPNRTPTSAENSQNAALAVHPGVQCDGCGLRPIVGPRFKSNKKENFDLCSNCHKEFNDADSFFKIDQPRPYSRPWHPLFQNYKSMSSATRNSSQPEGPFPRRDHHSRGQKPFFWGSGAPSAHCNVGERWNARFVKHVTIFDGTELAPGAHFTKIWRLRNSGSLPWPSHIRLVRVGGDDLGCAVSELLELSEHGLAPDEEIEASVDLIAPEKPGRYVSKWRLQLPFGPKFGHDVSVVIQVMLEEEELAHAQADEDVITPPAELQSAPGSEIVNIHSDEVIASNGSSSEIAMEKDASNISSVPAASMAMLGSVDGLTERPDIKILQSDVNVDTITLNNSTLSNQGKSVNPNTDALLAKLQLIGFTNKPLNLELLEKNQFDIRLTIEDLFTAADWEPMLQQLQEMGFNDMNLNLKLMFKNEGSIKRVVKELVEIQKPSPSPLFFNGKK